MSPFSFTLKHVQVKLCGNSTAPEVYESKNYFTEIRNCEEMFIIIIYGQHYIFITLSEKKYLQLLHWSFKFF